jgi:hypothetical protein
MEQGHTRTLREQGRTHTLRLLHLATLTVDTRFARKVQTAPRDDLEYHRVLVAVRVGLRRAFVIGDDVCCTSPPVGDTSICFAGHLSRAMQNCGTRCKGTSDLRALPRYMPSTQKPMGCCFHRHSPFRRRTTTQRMETRKGAGKGPLCGRVREAREGAGGPATAQEYQGSPGS